MTNRINLISGPRNISTTLMYSFANRDDFTVVDEPMYSYYLHRIDIDHPGREEILRSLPTDLDSVQKEFIFQPIDTPYYFIKNMAQHFIMEDWSFILELKNLFLIRDPKKLICSFSKMIPNPVMRDIGLKIEYELYDYLKSHGKNPIVLDSEEVLKNPEGMLMELCNRLEIPFSSKMLQWEAGPKAYDGVWAEYWYKNTHSSTTFRKNITKNEELPEHLDSLYTEALKYYEKLREGCIMA